MADGASVAAITMVQGEQSTPRTLGAYAQWLTQQGHTPVGEALPNHPGEILTKIADQASGLSNAYGDFKAESSKLLDPKAVAGVVADLRTDAHPGPARAGMDEASSGGAGGDPAAGFEGRVEAAAAALRDATVTAVERQMQQTVALLHHDLSMQVLRSSIEASISSGKQVQDGLEVMLRG